MAALMFMDFWQEQVELDRFDRLAKDLGVLWTKEEVQAQAEAKEKPSTRIPEEIRIPLAVSIESALPETIRNMFGRKSGILPPQWAKGEEVVELFDKDPEEFLNFVRTFVRPKVVGK